MEIRGSSGAQTTDLLYQLREEADGVRWLFVAHSEAPANPDLPKGDVIRLRIKGEWDATLYDTINYVKE